MSVIIGSALDGECSEIAVIGVTRQKEALVRQGLKPRLAARALQRV
jgi:hypothetical protein